jgi:predicted RNA methylase
MEFNNYKLSKFVDDFLVDNLNNINITNQYNSLNNDHNDNTSHIDKLSIEQYFPWNSNINFNHLKIDEIGKYSITLPKKADIISKIIQTYCNIQNRPIKITDATAGVGGNVLSFCKFGFDVNAIEIDKDRFEYLKHNINEYHYNVESFNDDYMNIYDKLNQDVIFVDPPWGGIDYKKVEEVTLKLGNTEIEDLCNMINNKKLAKLTVLKLPYNYDLNYVKNKINLPITMFKMKNILLLIIFNSF